MIRFAYTTSVACILFAGQAFADGRGVPINYDSLSFLENPLAASIGQVTVTGNALFDQSASYDHQQGRDEYNTRANASILAETQLPNSWRLGLQYIGTYNRLSSDEYNDNVALFIADEWGTIAVGNVTGSVFEETRRKRGIGNAELANDNFLGALDQWGAFYSVRYNSYLLSMTADLEGRAEAGLSFERPIGPSSYFVSARLHKGDLAENEDGTSGDSYGAALVGAYTYASFTIDSQLGYEVVEDYLGASSDDEDRPFASLGMQYQYGAYALSLEGGVGEFNDNTLQSAALGGRMDVARGMSFNVGVNYSNPQEKSNVTSIGSLRYEF